MKYNRSITISSTNNNSDYWLEEFEKTMNKYSVQSRSVNDNIFDQMNSIVNNSHPYASVEAVVDEMQERAGMKALKMNKQCSEDDRQILASESTSELLKEDGVIKTVENLINTSFGGLSVPAIIHELRRYMPQIDNSRWLEPSFIKYLQDQIDIVKSRHPEAKTNLQNGKMITDNTELDNNLNKDFFGTMFESSR